MLTRTSRCLSCLRNRLNVSRRFLATPRDISKAPQLNQFQDPQRPPEQFRIPNDSQPAEQVHPAQQVQNNQYPQVGINRGSPGSPVPPPPPQFESRRAFGVGRSVIGLVSLLLFTAGATGLYRSYQAESISEQGIEILEDAMSKEDSDDIDGAIDNYERFLKQLDEERVSHSNANYLGAAVRIAELYEIKGRADKALKIYETLSLYLTSLVTERGIDNDFFLDRAQYDAAMTRSLTVAIRYASLLPYDRAEEAKNILLTNIVQAQRRIMQEYPPFITVLNENTNQNILTLIARDMQQKLSGKTEEEKRQQLKEALKNPLELPIYTTDPTPENRLLGLFVKGWPVFTRVLINARDLYANICIRDGDYAEAASSLTTNAVIIQRCFDHPARLSICLTKLGIVLQMMAETLKRNLFEEKIKEEEEEEQDNVDHKDTAISLDPNVDPNMLLANAFRSQNPQIKEFVIQKTYSESERIFKKTLMLTDKMKQQHMQNQVTEFFRPALDKSEMVSSCGLALIGYQSGDYQDALKYLQRARVLAVRLNAADYLEDISKWIEQVEREKKSE
ncbi:DEKNAAC103394 [Brettanomyces naardenensis]|uniref:DEKNAAC103394 n=1 Tax=Brettanomyces naardenensis TaxID=13370 RepID=A0A448YN43_BRENA|nr:DEKNAAC103394 [Brettanomyces naardenensis]